MQIVVKVVILLLLPMTLWHLMVRMLPESGLELMSLLWLVVNLLRLLVLGLGSFHHVFTKNFVLL